MDKQTYETGLKIRSEVLGKEYVENAMKNADDFNQAVPGIRQRVLLGSRAGAVRASPRKSAACSIWR